MTEEKGSLKISARDWEIKYKKRMIFDLPGELLELNLNWAVIAKVFIEKNPLWFDRAGLWWSWSHREAAYRIIDETDILIMIDTATKRNNLKQGIKAEVLEALKREARKNEPIKPKDTWVQFGEKVFDILTGEEFYANSRYFFTNSIPWDASEDPETPILDSFLKDWCDEDYITLKEILAYSCLRDYPLQRIFVLLGTGSNGKSTYLQVINKFIGSNNVCAAELDMMLKERFQTTHLFNKLVCQMGETNFGTLKNTARLKKLTGNDLIDFEFKGKESFSAKSYAKIIIATNTLPQTLDKTDGFYRRWVTIDFTRQFTEKKDVLAEIPEEEYRNLSRFCINRLKKILLEKRFEREGTIVERKNRYESRSNPLQSFIEEFYEKIDDVETPASPFYDDFALYLNQRGHRKETYQEVRSAMKQMGYEYEKKRVPGFSNPIAVVTGLRLKRSSVPVVPSIPTSPISNDKRLENTGTNGTLEQFSVEKATLDELSELLKQQSNSFLVEERFGLEQVEIWKRTGLIVELPYGTFRLL